MISETLKVTHQVHGIEGHQHHTLQDLRQQGDGYFILGSQLSRLNPVAEGWARTQTHLVLYRGKVRWSIVNIITNGLLIPHSIDSSKTRRAYQCSQCAHASGRFRPVYTLKIPQRHGGSTPRWYYRFISSFGTKDTFLFDFL